MTVRPASWAPTLPAALLVALLAGGCGQEPEPAAPVAATCVVVGRVGPLARPDVPGVEAVCVDTARERCSIFALPDTNGNYRLALPTGAYLLRASIGVDTWYHRADGGLAEVAADAETLRVTGAGSPYTVDFPLGRLSIHANIPAMMAEESFAFEIRALDGDYAGDLNWSGVRQAPNLNLSLATAGLAEGEYKIRMRWSKDVWGQGEAYWLPADKGDEVARFRVEPYATTRVVLVLPTVPARLEGSATGAWQSMGLDPPMIALYDADNDQVAGPWRVDADGTFALPLLRPVPVRLAVDVDGINAWYGGSTRDEAPLLTPTLGATMSGLDMVTSGLRLRVAANDQASWSDWVYLRFYRPGADTPELQVSRPLKYQLGLANLPAGEWKLRVVPASWNDIGWRPQWFDRAATAADAEVLVIPAAGGVVARELVLEAGGTIVGTVTIGAPGSHWYSLMMTSTQSEDVIGRWGHDAATTHYSLRSLLDGDYRLGVVMDNSAPEPGEPWPVGTIWYPGTANWAEAATLTIAGADSLSGVDFTLP